MCVCVCVCVRARTYIRRYEKIQIVHVHLLRCEEAKWEGELSRGKLEERGQEMIEKQLTSSPWEGEVTSTCTMSGLTV